MPGERTITVRKGDFASTQREWDAVLQYGATGSPFSTPQWQELCWKYLRHDETELLLLSLKEQDTPIGIAPLCRQGSAISFISNSEVTDYLDFVVRRGNEEVFFKALLEALEAENWESLDLHNIPSASATLAQLPLLAQQMGHTITVGIEAVAPSVQLPDTWDAFLAMLTKKYRHELRRKIRRLTESDSFSYYALKGQQASDALDDFLRLHRVSKDEKSQFMDRRMEVFFRAMVSELGAGEMIRLYFLEVHGKRVSTALCFEYGDEFLLYNSGFDPEFGSLSVGLVLKALCIRDAIESGKKRFDFLRGNERYKYELGGKDVPICRCTVRRG